MWGSLRKPPKEHPLAHENTRVCDHSSNLGETDLEKSEL